MQKFPTELLKEWFLANRRSLPWRELPTPYRVWISEVMLQQTQVAVVIPYFEKWMRTFPNIEALAKASLESVLKCWEGLGYYSRARNLHRAAQQIMEHFQGELPSDPEKLATIKGIGPYTQGAIQSFAFHQKTSAVDGNVLRVLSRYLAYEEEIDIPKSKAHLQKFADEILPDNEPWIVAEGLIELGATVCAKKAHCEICPLKKLCLTSRHRLQGVLPRKRERPKTISLARVVAVVMCRGHYLVQKGEGGKVMADLYEFPYLELQDDWEKKLERVLGVKLKYRKPLGQQRHTFTRYRVTLFPHLFETSELSDAHLWKKKEELKELPFSSGHRRILNNIIL